MKNKWGKVKKFSQGAQSGDAEGRGENFNAEAQSRKGGGRILTKRHGVTKGEHLVTVVFSTPP